MSTIDTSTPTITCQWFTFRYESGLDYFIDKGFFQDGSPIELPVRETPRMYFVTFPSGWVCRCKKFNRFDIPATSWIEYYGGRIDPRRKYILRLVHPGQHLSRQAAA